MAQKRKITKTSKRIVIGENMKRIKAAAKSIAAKWYQGQNINPWNEKLALKRNKAWILNKMNQCYEIIDIGIDPTRSIRSRFYEMEKQIIKERRYPVIPYIKVKYLYGKEK